MLSIYIDDGWENVNLKNEKKHILIHTQLDWFEENFKRINDKNERSFLYNSNIRNSEKEG